MVEYTHPSATYPALPWIDVDPNGGLLIATANELAVLNSDGTQTHVVGSGFTYDVNFDPTGGIVSQVFRTAADGLTVLEQVTGNGGGSLGISLVALVTAGDGLGPAFNFALLGADNLTGNIGTDYLYGGPGADALNGAAGNDFADYSAATTGVGAFLSNPASNSGDAAGDTYTSIEGLRGSGFSDTLGGNAGANTLLGMGGNDNLRGLAGNDTIDGGAGFDEVRYDRDAAAGGAGAVNVNLAAGTATDGFGSTDTLVSIELIRGTNLADTLVGGNAINDNFEGYRGLGGNDVISGGSGYDETRYDQDAVNGGTAGVVVNLATGIATDGFGNIDTLSGIEGARGTAQADVFTGDAKSNQFFGLAGNDTITGGDGFDYVGFERDVDFGGLLGVSVNLATGVATDGFGNTDTLSGIQGAGGTSQSDSFTGSNFVGFYGDIFQGFAGNDTLIGGLGNDEARYDNDVDFGGILGVTANLANGLATDGFGNFDTLTGIEGVRGTNQADLFTGSASLNFFYGLAGNDFIDGGAGSDEVRYDRDAENGGAAGVTVSLASGFAVDGFGTTDTLISIERARGTAQVDTLIGDAGDNGFVGFAGNDVINGGGGNDEIRYDIDFAFGGLSGVTVNLAANFAIDGFGNTDSLSSIETVRGTRFADSFVGSAADEVFRGLGGNDSIDGGGGTDWVSYSRDIFSREESQTLSGVTVDLSAGTAIDSFGNTDGLASIENIGGGVLGDSLTGNAGDNVFRGLAGNDVINGLGGNDTVDYSEDQAYGDLIFMNGGGGVAVNLATGSALDGFGDTDSLVSVENAIGTAFADTFVASSAANLLNGGAGIDIVSYASAATGITANLDVGIGAGGDATGDAYFSIEGLVGSSFGDTLVGLAGIANTLNGGDGDDFIYGEGIDTVIGGSGSDVFFGGQGSALNVNLGTSSLETVWGSFVGDTMDGSTASANLTMVGQGLTGGPNADTMIGGSGNDFVYYRAGDVISGGGGNDWAVATLSASSVTLNMATSGFENAWGSTSGDSLTAAGSAASAVLVGDAGNDQLTGGNAGDFLYGFADNDTLVGGGGNDNLVGGDGTDTFSFGAGWGTDIVWDWAKGAEKFNMQGSGAADFSALTVEQNYFGSGNAFISFAGNHILVVGAANLIDSTDFIF